MKKVCAWCGATIKNDKKDDKVSHGICLKCLKSELRGLREEVKE